MIKVILIYQLFHIGILYIPSVEGKPTYYGSFKKNKMVDIFRVVK